MGETLKKYIMTIGQKKDVETIILNLPRFLKYDEFIVAFFILQYMLYKDKDKVAILRDALVDASNMSRTKIRRITDRLNEIGIIEKRTILILGKEKPYDNYKLNWEKTKDFLSNDDIKIFEENMLKYFDIN